MHALRNVSVTFASGSFTAVMGPSGSGKSTFLHCAAGLDRPTNGSVWLGDIEISTLSESRATKLRRRRIGFVFQTFNLLPALTVAQNIAYQAGPGPDDEDARPVFQRRDPGFS